MPRTIASSIPLTLLLVYLGLVLDERRRVHSLLVTVTGGPIILRSKPAAIGTVVGRHVPSGWGPCPSHSALYAKKKTSSKKAVSISSSSSSGGLKGFGTVALVAGGSGGGGTTNGAVTLDTSSATRSFYHDFLSCRAYDASDNWKRTALGYTPLSPSTTSTASSTSSSTTSSSSPKLLRGVIATRDIAKGSPILDLPYECAVNLGPEGDDPTVPALLFLRDYCATLHSNDDSNNQRRHYYRMLPPYQGEDCRGSTDFFTDEALQALQSPLIVEETLQRRRRTAERWATITTNNTTLEPSPSTFFHWIEEGGTAAPVTVDHLQWAVWVITSRVLTVQQQQENGTAAPAVRLLIPYLDMCNHDRQSPHILTGRAVPGGRLRIVAGANVPAGTPIQIGYGGGAAGNDRFVQDYGFLDGDERAYDLVAQGYILASSNRNNKQRILSKTDRERSLLALRATTMREDEALLAAPENENHMDAQIRTAIQYRLGVKKALSKYMDME